VQRDCALAGGDDYELAFTAPPAAREGVFEAGRASGTAVTRIGSITQGAGLAVLDAAGAKVETTRRAYDHFTR
jgi:thiamine-monophosphate kinase